MVPISRLPVLATLSGSRPNEETCTESDISRLPVLAALIRSRPDEGTCTESDNANVISDTYPMTNVDETDDDQEDDNRSCLENEIINEDNSSTVDSALELDNNKT